MDYINGRTLAGMVGTAGSAPVRQEGSTRKCSFFIRPANNPIPSRSMSLEDVENYIKTNERAKSATEQLRGIITVEKAREVIKAIGGNPDDFKTPKDLMEKAQKEYKSRNFDYVIFTGEYSRRGNAYQISDSGLMCMDIDHIPEGNFDRVKLLILNEPLFQTVALFRSPRGEGLKWVINKTNTPEGMSHPTYYKAVARYMKETHGVILCDGSTALSQPCFLPYDSDAVFAALDIYPDDESYFDPSKWIEERTLPSANHVAEAVGTDEFVEYDRECEREGNKGRVERLVAKIERSGIDITEGYARWRNIGFALAHELGEDGRNFYHRISCFYGGYSSEQCDTQFSACLNDKSRIGGIGLGTLFGYAKEAGIGPDVWGNVQTKEEVEDDEPEGPIAPLCFSESNSAGEVTEWRLLEADLEKMVMRMAEAMQCPPDFILSSMFAAISVAIGTRIKVTNGIYTNYPLLWMCIVAPSGSNKSEPLKRILRPIQDKDRKLYDAYKDFLTKWKEDGSKGIQPKAACTIISDTTPESRNMALADNPCGILWYCDELSTLLGNIGRYTKSGEQSQMLSLWDGDTIKVDRKGDGVLRIDKPFCSIVSTTQPGVLAKMMSGTEFTESGFNTRWLFCYPKELPKRYYSKEKFSDAELEPWRKVISKIYERLSVIALENPIIAGLNNDAESRYMAFWNELQSEVGKAGAAKDDYLSSIYSKAQIQTLRLSLIVHVLRWGGIPDGITIDGPSMALTIETMRGFIRGAVRVKSDIESGGGQLTKKDLFQELKSLYPNINQSKLAEGLGVTHQYVNKMFKQR